MQVVNGRRREMARPWGGSRSAMAERIPAVSPDRGPGLLKTGMEAIQKQVTQARALTEPDAVLYAARTRPGAAGSSGWAVSSCWPTARVSGIPGTSDPQRHWDYW